MVRLSAWVQALASNEARTLQQLSVPGLLWSGVGANPGESWERTGVVNVKPATGGADPFVTLLEKVPGRNNPFAMGVTVGRIESNDIIVDDASVSRFHAWFQRDERTGKWSLTDAESKNGTFVANERLAEKARVVLTDGVLVRFGDVEMQFHEAESLVKLVRAAKR